MLNKEEIANVVREILEKILNKETTLTTHTEPTIIQSIEKGRVLTEGRLRELYNTGKRIIYISTNTLITPLAKDTAKELGIKISIASEIVANPQVEQVAKRNSPLKCISIGADHGGFEMKEILKSYLKELDYQIKDCGCYNKDSVDYPDFASAVAKAVANGECDRGIMIDGAGIGSCIAANKIKGIRAAMCYDLSTIINSREHNDANVLTLGAGLLGISLVKQMVKIWLETDFAGGRHKRRVDKIMMLE